MREGLKRMVEVSKCKKKRKKVRIMQKYKEEGRKEVYVSWKIKRSREQGRLSKRT